MPVALGITITRAQKDVGLLDLKEVVGKSDQGITQFQLKFLDLMVPDKYNKDQSSLDVQD